MNCACEILEAEFALTLIDLTKKKRHIYLSHSWSTSSTWCERCSPSNLKTVPGEFSRLLSPGLVISIIYLFF